MSCIGFVTHRHFAPVLVRKNIKHIYDEDKHMIKTVTKKSF